MGYFGGVDLGATSIRSVVATDDDVLGRDHRSTPDGPGGRAVTEAVVASLRAASERAGIDTTRIGALGIATIGPLDPTAGIVDDPANLAGVDRIELTDPVRDRIGGPVTLLNDATAGLIGEREAVDGEVDDLVYLTISTGIGAGVCVDGSVLTGWDGNAGEVGHVQLDPDGCLECGCGEPGHWEAYCSGENIPRYARYLLETEDIETTLPVESLTTPAVFGAEDDPLADLLVERMATWNTQGVATIVHAYAPEVVAIGGAVATNNPRRVVDPIRDRLPDRVIVRPPEVRLATRGEHAVVMGALARVREADPG